MCISHDLLFPRGSSIWTGLLPLLVAVLHFTPTTSYAQESSSENPPSDFAFVELDLTGRTPPTVPFNVPTVFQAVVPENVDSIRVAFTREIKSDEAKPDMIEWGRPSDSDIIPVSGKVDLGAIYFFRPNQTYKVTVEVVDLSDSVRVAKGDTIFVLSSDGHVTIIDGDSTKYEHPRTVTKTAIRNTYRIVDSIEPVNSTFHGVQIGNPVTSTYQAQPRKEDSYSFRVRPRAGLKHYFGSTIGVLYATRPTVVYGTTLLNVHLDARNPNSDLGSKEFNYWQHIGQRVSLFVGVAPLTIYNKNDTPIRNATDVGNFVYGVSARSLFYLPRPCFLNTGFGRVFLQPLTIHVGVLRFSQEDPNPLIDDTETLSSFVVGASLNIGIKELISPLSGLFPN